MNSTSEVKPTSRSSYYDHVISGKAKTQREQIMEFMEWHQLPLNRRQLSLTLDIPINAICGRVKALIDNGDLQISHIDRDPVTDKRVEYLEVTYKVIQARLF